MTLSLNKTKHTGVMLIQYTGWVYTPVTPSLSQLFKTVFAILYGRLFELELIQIHSLPKGKLEKLSACIMQAVPDVWC